MDPSGVDNTVPTGGSGESTFKVRGNDDAAKKERTPPDLTEHRRPRHPPPPTYTQVAIKTWKATAYWTWNAGENEDCCGICRNAFEQAAPDCRFPGDESPVVWGVCSHAFHLQCINKWLSSQSESRCPLCRTVWEFKTDERNEVAPPVPHPNFR